MKKSTFFLLCLEGAVLSFNVAATAAIVPSVAVSFALPQFYAGKIVWLYMIPYGIAALIYGPLVRVLDARKVELGCMFVFSAANIMAALAVNIHELFVARFLMGLFGASVIPLGIILIARHIEGRNRGRYVGIFFAATFVASLVGLGLSGFVNWRLIYLIPGMAGFLLWIAMYFALPKFGTEAKSFKFNYLSAFKNKKILFLFTYIFFISLIYHGVQQWLGVYFSTRFGFTQFVISMLITLTSLSGIFGEVMGGHLADLLGRIRTVNLGIILMALSVFLLIPKSPVFILAAIMLIWGFGWTCNHAGLSTSLTDLPAEYVNEAASLNSGIRFVSGGLGAVIGGLAIQYNFAFGFMIFAAGLILLLVLDRRLLNFA